VFTAHQSPDSRPPTANCLLTKPDGGATLSHLSPKHRLEAPINTWTNEVGDTMLIGPLPHSAQPNEEDSEMLLFFDVASRREAASLRGHLQSPHGSPFNARRRANDMRFELTQSITPTIHAHRRHRSSGDIASSASAPILITPDPRGQSPARTRQTLLVRPRQQRHPGYPDLRRAGQRSLQSSSALRALLCDLCVNLF